MDKLAEQLARFADKLGIEVVRLWPRVVQVYWTQELIDRLIWTVAVPIIGFLAVWLYHRGQLASKGKSEPQMAAWWLCFWIAIVLTVILSFIWIGTFPHSFSALTNPEATLVLDKLNAVNNCRAR